MADLQEKSPGIVGPNSGMPRAYSLANMSWALSLLIGPILTGALVQIVGYFYMTVTVGT